MANINLTRTAAEVVLSKNPDHFETWMREIELSMISIFGLSLGTWNASTNTPTIVSGAGTRGSYYYVSVAGSTMVDGENSWEVGDIILFSGSVWGKLSGLTPPEYESITTDHLANKAVTNAKLADMPAATVKGAIDAGVPVNLTMAALAALLGIDRTLDAEKPISAATQTALGLKLATALVGAANGVAPLDGASKVPAIYLPAFVDDVIEAANFAALPATGETGKIYVTIDDGKTYRWGGSAYAEISASPGSTDAVTEGATNLYFTAARALAAVTAIDVLTKIKTVDGSGSGLDADVVRGVTPSTFGLSLLDDANAAAARTTLGLASVAASGSASDLTGGTVANARLPTRLQSYSTLISDCNTVLDFGAYITNSSTTNKPAGVDYGHLLVIPWENSYHQVQWHVQTETLTTHRRKVVSGVPSTWERVRETEAELDARYALLTNLLTLLGGSIDPSNDMVSIYDASAGGMVKVTVSSLVSAATAGVSTFEGRSGAVVSQAGDYTASEITNTPAGGIAATTVQAALNELDTEKIATTVANARYLRKLSSGELSTADDTSIKHDGNPADSAANTAALNTLLASLPSSGGVLEICPGTIASGALATISNKSICIKGRGGSGLTNILMAGTSGNWLTVSQNSQNLRTRVSGLTGIKHSDGSTTGALIAADYPLVASSSLRDTIDVDDVTIRGATTAVTFGALLRPTNAWHVKASRITGEGVDGTPATLTALIDFKGKCTVAHLREIKGYWAHALVAYEAGYFSEGMYLDGFHAVATNWAVDAQNGLDAPGLHIANGHAETFYGGVRAISHPQLNLSNALFYKRLASTQNWAGLWLEGISGHGSNFSAFSNVQMWGAKGSSAGGTATAMVLDDSDGTIGGNIVAWDCDVGADLLNNSDAKVTFYGRNITTPSQNVPAGGSVTMIAI